MASVTTPWIDPLGLLDTFCRVALEPKLLDLIVYAKIRHTHNDSEYLPKGKPRREWDGALEPTARPTPVVTYVPFLKAVPTSDHTTGWRLTWHPLEFAHLQQWLIQLASHGYEPDALANL